MELLSLFFIVYLKPKSNIFHVYIYTNYGVRMQQCQQGELIYAPLLVLRCLWPRITRGRPNLRFSRTTHGLWIICQSHLS